MPHPRGSDAAKIHMEKIRKVKLEKGSPEAKLFMQNLRNKKGKSKKDLSKDNSNVQSTDSKS